MIRNKQIQEWLDDDYKVRSAAIGRVGKILGITDQGEVLLKSVKPSIGHCVTTFERGDSCHAERINGEIVICNDDR